MSEFEITSPIIYLSHAFWKKVQETDDSSVSWAAGKFQFSLHFILSNSVFLDITLNHIDDDRGVSTTNNSFSGKAFVDPFHDLGAALSLDQPFPESLPVPPISTMARIGHGQ